MSKINDLHEKAMEFCDEAFFAKRNGDMDSFIRFSRQALELEVEAANLLKDNFDDEPSRSILYRSAASMAIDCKEYRQAEKLISMALVGNPPNEIVAELRELLELLPLKQQSKKIKSAKLTIANKTFEVSGYQIGKKIFLQESASKV